MKKNLDKTFEQQKIGQLKVFVALFMTNIFSIFFTLQFLAPSSPASKSAAVLDPTKTIMSLPLDNFALNAQGEAKEVEVMLVDQENRIIVKEAKLIKKDLDSQQNSQPHYQVELAKNNLSKTLKAILKGPLKALPPGELPINKPRKNYEIEI